MHSSGTNPNSASQPVPFTRNGRLISTTKAAERAGIRRLCFFIEAKLQGFRGNCKDESVDQVQIPFRPRRRKLLDPLQQALLPGIDRIDAAHVHQQGDE